MSHADRPRRVVLMRTIAALAPVLLVLVLWYAARWSNRVPQGESVQLTNGRSFEGLPSLSPDGDLIAYRNDATGNGDIYVRSLDGREVINLTSGSFDDETDPAFSFDGELIAFASARSGIAIVPRAGGQIRRLTREGVNPTWTPDGKFIIYSGGAGANPDFRAGASEGWKVEVATGATIRLPVADFHEPVVSPHGRRIAYWGRPVDPRSRRRVIGARGQIWTSRLDGTDELLVTGDAAHESSPMWSPDGRFLYYVSNRNGPSSIWRVRIDERSGRTRGRPVLVPTPRSQPAHLTRSADGRRIAWSDATPIQRAMQIGFDADARTTRGAATEILTGDKNWESAELSPDGSHFVLSSANGHLHIVSANGVTGTPVGDARSLTGEEALDRNPRWSPDGRWIAFQSNRGGSYSVWLVRPDGRDLRVLPRAAGDLLAPVWSPDGEQLAVWDTSVQGSRIVRFDGELTLSDVLPAQVQGPFTPADWSSDGQWIAGTVAGNIWIYSIADRDYEQLRPGANPVWLGDGRRLLYSYAGRLYIADARLKISRELLSIPDQQLDAPRLSRDNRYLYFSESGTDANLWLMTTGPS